MINDLDRRVAARTWPHQTAHQFREAGSRDAPGSVKLQVGAIFGGVDVLQQTLGPLHTAQALCRMPQWYSRKGYAGSHLQDHLGRWAPRTSPAQSWTRVLQLLTCTPTRHTLGAWLR
jgi:hypothetical protein